MGNNFRYRGEQKSTVGDYRGSHKEMFPTVLEVPWVTVPWVTGDTKYRGEQKSTVGGIIGTVGDISGTVGNKKVPWVTVPWGTSYLLSPTVLDRCYPRYLRCHARYLMVMHAI